MSVNDPEKFHELLAKVQAGAATKEELQWLLRILEQPDHDALLPYESWLQSRPEPLSSALKARVLQAATGKKGVYRWPVRRWLPYAAAILVIAALYFYRQAKHVPEAAYTVATAGFGEIKRLVLPDSTVVILNARSSLRYLPGFTPRSREVHLEGEAFFDVRGDKNRPFTVHSRGLHTLVLGTTFNMKDYAGERPLVAVLSGKVKVNGAAGLPVVLGAGQQAVYDSAVSAFARQAGNIKDMGSWRHGMIDMNNRTLGDVAAELERWYDVDIRLRTPGIGNYVLSGAQTNESLSTILESICFVFNLQYKQEGRTVSISKQ